ncbi:phage minor head protein, partial [Kribbella deserti]
NAEGGLLSRSAILRSTRLRLALIEVSGRLAAVADQAGVTVSGDLDGIVQAAVDAQENIAKAQLPKAELDAITSWARVDARQIDAIVRRTTERITSALWPLSAEADAAMRRELVRGLMAGSGPRQTAARIVQRAEGQFNGGLARALTIVRTETLDAHRAAAAAAHKANSDVLAGWIWLTSLSGKPCPACLGMSGTVHPLTEPGPQGHQNCRCTRMPKTKTWRELGIDLPEEPDQVPSAANWFNKQPVKRQKDILGPARYAAWKRGDYPMDQWAVKRANADWRPSYVTSPLPNGGRDTRLAS